MKEIKIKQNSVNFKIENRLSIRKPVSRKKNTLPYIRFGFKCVVMYF